VSERPRVAVIDDGELGRIRRALGDSEVELTHLRGQVIPEDLEGPFDLVVATVKRILDLEGKLDLSGLPGKPTWIAVHGQDFLPLRIRRRKLGIHFLVQSSVEQAALRLLLQHVLYRGPERRDGTRLPVGAAVVCTDDRGEKVDAALLDLTRDGCRLSTERAFEVGAELSIAFPAKLAGGREIPLPGRVVRTIADPGSERRTLGVAFGGIDAEASDMLDAIIEGKVIGTVVTPLGGALASAAPAEPSSAEDESTETAWPHERLNPRTPYTREVTLLLHGRERVLLGRDLSIAGMRAAHAPDLPVGTRLELAIYGASGAEPVLVEAVVARDDGALGTIFHFERMANADRRRLAAIVEKAPKIRSLSGDESGESVVVSSLSRRKT